MPTTLEMAIRLLCLGKRECPIDDRVQVMRMAIARFMASKSARLPTLIEPSVMPRPVSNKGSSPPPEGVRLAPIRLICPPTAKALSDIAIVPGPPISTTQSTPLPSVNSRALKSMLLHGSWVLDASVSEHVWDRGFSRPKTAV
jgi:hypothetical protein